MPNFFARKLSDHLGATQDTPEKFSAEHVTVLKAEAIAMLAPKSGEILLDGTAGQGGHSEALLAAAPGTRIIALDADPHSVASSRERLVPFGERATVVEANFADAPAVLASLGVEHVDAALLDLGWNRGQLMSGRGFSFQHDEPLNMSYADSPRSGFNASEIVNGWEEEVLADVFYGYGEERYARRIARAIVTERERAPIETSGRLAEIIKHAVPVVYAHGRVHPATKSFQALRIAVNDELGVITQAVAVLVPLLAHGGRLGIITFHSTEDRMVKHLFAGLVAEGKVSLLTKKPIVPSDTELTNNPSARSAKLRGLITL